MPWKQLSTMHKQEKQLKEELQAKIHIKQIATELLIK
jgi:hypothetical protein